MTELTLALIKLAFLAVLWLFVLTAVGVIRADLFGGRSPAGNLRPRGQAQPRKQPARPARKEKEKQAAAGKAEAPGRGQPKKIVVTGGARSGSSHALSSEPVTIGRDKDATFVLSDEYASSRHARLFPRNGQWLVEDLGSTNGTYLDGSRVNEPVPVPCGVPIRIGKTILELRR